MSAEDTRTAARASWSPASWPSSRSRRASSRSSGIRSASSPFAILLALIAAAMAPKDARLPLIAVVVGASAFVVGMTIAVTTNNPLY